MPTRFLKVYRQVEVGTGGYDQGAKILYDFFRAELPKFLKDELNPTGRKIIEACLDNAGCEEYVQLLPMDYQYSFFAEKSEADE